MGKGCNNEVQGSWIQIYNVLKELFINAYKWDNVPTSINQRYLNLRLFEGGQVAFFYDETLEQHLVLQCTMAGNLDVYYEPTKVNVIGGNGYNRVLTNHKDCVIIYNNYVRDTPQLRIMDFAKRIWNIEQTIDINIHAQRTPILIKTSKKQEFTLKNLYQQYGDYKPCIIVNDEMDATQISSINTSAPFVADKLEEQKRKLWNEVLSYIGIDNNSSEKNERLTQNEVLISNGLAVANRSAKLQARQVACNEINKMFSLNISVSVNTDSYLDYAIEGDEVEQI